jgi:hypothetical protein
MERRSSGYAVENSRGGSIGIGGSRGMGGSRALSQLMPTASSGQRNGDERRYSKHSSSSTGPAFDRGNNSSNEGPSNQKRSAMVVHEAVVTNNHIRTRNKLSNQHQAQTKPPPTVIDLLDDEPPVAPVAAPSLDTESFYRSLLGDSIVDSQLQGATGPVGGRIPVDRIYLGAFPFESHSPRCLSIRVDANLSECILLGINDCDAEGLLSLNPVEYEKIPFKSIKKIS